MNKEDLPGHREVKDLGYTLDFYSGNFRSATYTKEGIVLNLVYKEDNSLEARLGFIWKLVKIETLNFSFPNKNFKIFEKQILLAKSLLGDN